MVIAGHVENGVVVLEHGGSLPEGTAVSVVVRAGGQVGGDGMSLEQRRRYLDALARIDSIANENSGDAFSSADHDSALYG